jgi:hypothetical protein
MKNCISKTMVSFYIIFAITLPIFTAYTTYGQTTVDTTQKYTLLEPSFNAGNNSPDLSSYLQNLFYILLGLAGVAAIVQIVRGGLMYMTPDSIGGKTEGKKLIREALTGLILAIASALILNEINPNLLKIDILNVQDASAYSGGDSVGDPVDTGTIA